VPLNSRQRDGPPVYGNDRNGCTETIGIGVRKPPERATEDRFKVLKDFLGLRPVRHFTESRVHGHIGNWTLQAPSDAGPPPLSPLPGASP
jgi:hypothetical protein